MGDFWTYQAVPPRSGLIERADDDRAFAYALGLVGSYAFDPRQASSRDRRVWAESLLVEDGVTTDKAEARRLLDEVFSEFDALRIQYPGTEDHCVTRDKGARNLQEALVASVGPSCGSLIEALVSGERPLVSLDVYAWLVPPKTVQEGAECLRPLSVSEAYSSRGVVGAGGPRDFVPWRQFYLDAAERGDLCLVFAT